ncbi:hypothetical protein PWT90_10605 [Aphanocladium album]|nr:hypothetical protein PWT90_10605 [Aphanocladium album]
MDKPVSNIPPSEAPTVNVESTTPRSISTADATVHTTDSSPEPSIILSGTGHVQYDLTWKKSPRTGRHNTSGAINASHLMLMMSDRC